MQCGNVDVNVCLYPGVKYKLLLQLTTECAFVLTTVDANILWIRFACANRIYYNFLLIHFVKFCMHRLCAIFLWWPAWIQFVSLYTLLSLMGAFDYIYIYCWEKVHHWGSTLYWPVTIVSFEYINICWAMWVLFGTKWLFLLEYSCRRRRIFIV